MKNRFNKRCEFLISFILIFIISFFCITTLITEGQYIFVASHRDAKKEFTEENTVFENAKIFIKTFEDTFSESIFKRSSITPYASKLNSVLMNGRTIDSPDVTLGKDNWLFYTTATDGQPLIDYSGSQYYDEAMMQATADRLEANRSLLADKGIEFALMVVPNKEQIYSEYMPDTVIRYSETSRTDVLVDYINTHSNVNVIYPKQELNELKDDYALYYKYDSHWTELGAFIAYEQMTDVFFSEREQLKDKTITAVSDTNRERADLIKMTGLTSWFGYDNHYLIEDMPDEKYDKTILFIGDSCREALEKFIDNGFTNAVVIHRKDYSPEVLDAVDPDLVVLEYVERYSDKIKDFTL